MDLGVWWARHGSRDVKSDSDLRSLLNTHGMSRNKLHGPQGEEGIDLWGGDGALLMKIVVMSMLVVKIVMMVGNRDGDDGGVGSDGDDGGVGSDGDGW